jgi:hypothetical protein
MGVIETPACEGRVVVSQELVAHWSTAGTRSLPPSGPPTPKPASDSIAGLPFWPQPQGGSPSVGPALPRGAPIEAKPVSSRK